MMSPALGSNALIAPTYLPVMLNHIKEHLALWYAYSVFELGTEATGKDIGDMLKELKTPEDKRAFDGMLAEASQTVTQEAGNVFQSLPPIIQQAQQMMQALAPQPPMDPNAQAAMEQLKLQAQQIQMRAQTDAQRIQIEGAKAQQQAQTDQAKLQLDQAKLQLDAQQEQARLAGDMAVEQQENQRKQAEMQVRQAMNTQDNLTAMELAKLELETGERFAVSTGTGINP
jgi:hypothetical protein